MNTITSIVRDRPNLAMPVKSRILQCLQDWKYISRNNADELFVIAEAVHGLEKDGFELPPPDPVISKAGEAFTDTPIAPEWSDNPVCTRCRSEFGTFLRKHHCRNCGRIFCYKCSAKTMPLPWYCINSAVRVCDGCFQRKGPVSNPLLHNTTTRSASSPSVAKEEDELARVMELSLKEYNERNTSLATHSLMGSPRKGDEQSDVDDDPDLAAAIAASLREQDARQQKDKAVLGTSSASRQGYQRTELEPSLSKTLQTERPLDVHTNDLDNILTFHDTILRRDAPWAKNVATDGIPQPVQNIHDKAAVSRAKLARKLDLGHRRLRELSSLQEKLSEVVKMYDRLLDSRLGERDSLHVTESRPDGANFTYRDPFGTSFPLTNDPDPSAPPAPLSPSLVSSAPLISDSRTSTSTKQQPSSDSMHGEFLIKACEKNPQHLDESNVQEAMLIEL